MDSKELLGWVLEKFELDNVLEGLKTILFVDEPLQSGTFIHTNGITLKIVRQWKGSFSTLTDDELYACGIKWGLIPASCEHPPLQCIYYGTTMYSSPNNPTQAITQYLKDTKQEGIYSPRWFYEFELYPSKARTWTKDERYRQSMPYSWYEGSYIL